jgi:hypothetical protein
MADAKKIREDLIAEMHDWLNEEGTGSNGRDQDIVDEIETEYPGGVEAFLFDHE